MVEHLDAYKVADKVELALLQGCDKEASQKALSEVDKDLQKLSPFEKTLVSTDLAAKGLLPEISIATGLVDSDGASYDELLKLANREGFNTLKGLSARQLFADFDLASTKNGDSRVEERSLLPYDHIRDEQLEAAHVYGEYDSLLNLVKQLDPNDFGAQNKDSISKSDIERLIKIPDALNRVEQQALKTMRDHFYDISQDDVITRSDVHFYSQRYFPLSEYKEFVADNLRSINADLEERAKIGQAMREAGIKGYVAN